MKIECTPEELAALVVALQERREESQETMDAIAERLSSFHILESQ